MIIFLINSGGGGPPPGARYGGDGCPFVQCWWRSLSLCAAIFVLTAPPSSSMAVLYAAEVNALSLLPRVLAIPHMRAASIDYIHRRITRDFT